MTFSRRWSFPEYNFTLAIFWFPFRVKAREPSENNGLTTLELDKPEEFWASEIHRFDYVIISTGQWFYRSMVFQEKGNVIGCFYCGQPNVTHVSRIYAQGMVFRTLMTLKGYKGMTFLRTFSTAHFENGTWNGGGHCPRTKPFARNEGTDLFGSELEFYSVRVEEFRAVEKEGRKRGFEFKLLDTTGAVRMRPDGHPNSYGHSPHKNMTVTD